MGRPESWAEERVQSLGLDFERVEYGISAKPGELLLRFIAADPKDHAYIDTIREKITEAFGTDLVIPPERGKAEDEFPEHARIVHELLLAAGTTVATCESCTGGMIAARLTEYPDSSAYFRGSTVAYHDDVKREVVGVDPGILRKHGAVSEPVCRSLAEGARRLFRTDYGIGVTGIAGPGGGSDAKPVGLVFVGLATPDGAVIIDRHVYSGARPVVRSQTATRALDLLRRSLQSRH